MNSNCNDNDDKMKKNLKIIETILTKYKTNSAWVLYGLEIVGFENSNFWLNVVDYVSKAKGIDALSSYVIPMSQMNKEDLLEFLRNINNPELFPEFVDSYLMFVNLLKEVSEIKKDTKKSK